MKKFTKIAAATFLMVAGLPGAAQNNDAPQSVTITCNLITESEMIVTSEITLASKTTNLATNALNPWQGNSFTGVTPEIYDILLSATDQQNKHYFVLKSNINVQNDTTIDFDVNETNLFDTKAYNPEGELLKTDYWDFVDGAYVCVEEGNIKSCIRRGVLLRKADGLMITNISAINTNVSYYFNDFGSDFIFIESDLYYNDEADSEFYLTKYYKDGNGTSCLENNVNDYVCTEDEFVPSIVGRQFDKNSGISFDLVYDGKIVTTDNVNLSRGNWAKIWSCVPFEDENHFNVLFKQAFGETVKVIDEYRDENDVIVYSDTLYQSQINYGPSIAVKDGVKQFISNNYIVNTSNDFLNDNNNYYSKSVYPGSPMFSYVEDERCNTFGDNVPINLFIETGMVNFMNPSEILPVFNCNYIGRCGEYRKVDLQPMEMSMTVNGEPINTTYAGLSDYFAPWNFGRVKGVTEFTFDNQNIEVDGMPGRNLTRVYLDESKDDHCAPTLTMLQMRDGNGTVTDRFETAQDGKVTFSCGDFNCQMEEIPVMVNGFENRFQKFYFECERPIVEVNVAPYGLDNWQPVSITEDDNSYMPIGFGHVFNADITALNTEGWYDLKFKLTDATGNWQEQTISPAFRIGIGNPTGIDVVKNSDATEVARYTIEGRAINTPQAGVNIVKMSDGTVKKVLVK